MAQRVVLISEQPAACFFRMVLLERLPDCSLQTSKRVKETRKPIEESLFLCKDFDLSNQLRSFADQGEFRRFCFDEGRALLRREQRPVQQNVRRAQTHQ